MSHYGMPNHVTTMRHLAFAVYGTSDYRVANQVYGGFARRVRLELDVARPRLEIGILPLDYEATVYREAWDRIGDGTMPAASSGVA